MLNHFTGFILNGGRGSVELVLHCLNHFETKDFFSQLSTVGGNKMC